MNGRSDPSPGHDEAKRRKRRRRRLAILGGLACILLLLLLRAFVFDIEVVSGESMWPALQGGLDRVGISKLRRRPERFEIWVHESRSLEGKAERRVKRIASVGPEFVHFRGGDIWISKTRNPEDFQRAQRPASVAEKMLVKLYDSETDDAEQHFDVRSGRLEGKAGEGLLLSADGAKFYARFRGSAERDRIDDGGPLPKGGWHRGESAVPDVSVEFVLSEISDGAEFRLRHEIAGDDMLSALVKDGHVVVERGFGNEVAKVRFPELPLGIRVETRDGVARVLTFVPTEPEEKKLLFSGPRDTLRLGEFSAVDLTLDRGRARLAELDVRRDVHYFVPPWFVAAWVPVGSVFLVGDNAAASEDSRDIGPVPIRRLSGRVSLVLWPPGRWISLP